MSKGRWIDIFGPMFAQKTYTLRAFGKSELVARRYVYAFKHEKDRQRYKGDDLQTHDGLTFPAKCVSNAIEIYQHLRERVKENKITKLSKIAVLIDEAQFFPTDLVDFCLEFRPYMRIYTAHLHRDAFDNPFEFDRSKRHVGELMALANQRVHLKAVCNYSERGSLDVCGEEADFTQRLDAHGEPVLAGKKVAVGGADKYAPRCDAHYQHSRRVHPVFSVEDLLAEAEEIKEELAAK